MWLKTLFTTRGTRQFNRMEQSDGSQMLFVADRGDHSIIGILRIRIRLSIGWLSILFTRPIPHWSPDGKRLFFIRTPGDGGEADSMLVRRHNPWSIYTADIATNQATLLWKRHVP